MDLSAIIFVVLALAWAVYLIPKALQHHDEMASDRLVEGHTDKVRILSRRGGGKAGPEVVEVEVEHTDTVERTTPAPAARPVTRPVTRAGARTAAKRRRRVLGVLLLVLAVVVGLAAFALAPWWTVAIPAGLIVAFLVTARVSVRRTQHASAPTQRPLAPAGAGPAARPAVEGDTADSLVDRLVEEEVTVVERQEVEAALADDGSLWDPLPMTLPTYVNKARARRTVRTIELTGINSSGHDTADTTLAREAAAVDTAASSTEAARRVAGM